ncbi:MAG TPA: transglycosylase SLT domain-containing protein [Stellaceae bacterium]|jgi:TPR repeat protein|nr:transglycosylase SLT domain-containing protein [Stellaceae bacterium]
MSLRTALAALIRTTAVAAVCGIVPLPAVASADDAAAQFALAVRYEHAEGVPRDYGHALELYCVAAGHGHADASFNIAWIYLNGRGVARDDTNGAAWLRVAADRGHQLAGRLLGRLGAVPAAKPTGCRQAEPAVPVKSAGTAVPSKEIARLVAEAAAANQIDPKLVLAVIATESAFQIAAVSPRNAGGLMQLMPETAERFGVKDVFDAGENIRGGTKYLRWLLTYFDGDLSLALAAYNAGEGAVTRYGGIPPFAETRAYVEKIRAIYRPEPHKPAPRAERIAMR